MSKSANKILIIFSLGIIFLSGCISSHRSPGNESHNNTSERRLKRVVTWKGFRDCSDWRGKTVVMDYLSSIMEEVIDESGCFCRVNADPADGWQAESDRIRAENRNDSESSANPVMASRYILRGVVARIREIKRKPDGLMDWLKGVNGDAEVVVIVTVVDGITGESIGSARGCGRVPCRVGNLSGEHQEVTSLRKFVRSRLGKASEKCMEDVVEKVSDMMTSLPLDVCVTSSSSDNKVVINRGSEIGLVAGDRLDLFSDNGLMIGRIIVLRTDAGVSYCEVEKGVVRHGMMVRMRESSGSN